MNIKSNVKQAWGELTGGLGLGKNDQPENQSDPGFNDQETDRAPETIGLELVGNDYPRYAAIVPRQAEPQTYPVSILTEGLSIRGDIKALGDIELHGIVKGNIDGEGNITITGRLLGEVNCQKSVSLKSHAAMQGNITATGAVSLAGDAVVIGDIKAKSILADGKIKGNIIVEETAALHNRTAVIGDITAKKIAVSEGAQIIGAIKINETEATDIEFDDIRL